MPHLFKKTQKENPKTTPVNIQEIKNVRHIAFSPDSAQIAIALPKELHILNTNNGNVALQKTFDRDYDMLKLFWSNSCIICVYEKKIEFYDTTLAIKRTLQTGEISDADLKGGQLIYAVKNMKPSSIIYKINVQNYLSERPEIFKEFPEKITMSDGKTQYPMIKVVALTLSKNDNNKIWYTTNDGSESYFWTYTSEKPTYRFAETMVCKDFTLQNGWIISSETAVAVTDDEKYAIRSGKMRQGGIFKSDYSPLIISKGKAEEFATIRVKDSRAKCVAISNTMFAYADTYNAVLKLFKINDEDEGKVQASGLNAMLLRF